LQGFATALREGRAAYAAGVTAGAWPASPPREVALGPRAGGAADGAAGDDGPGRAAPPDDALAPERVLPLDDPGILVMRRGYEIQLYDVAQGRLTGARRWRPPAEGTPGVTLGAAWLDPSHLACWLGDEVAVWVRGAEQSAWEYRSPEPLLEACPAAGLLLLRSERDVRVLEAAAGRLTWRRHLAAPGWHGLIGAVGGTQTFLYQAADRWVRLADLRNGGDLQRRPELPGELLRFDPGSGSMLLRQAGFLCFLPGYPAGSDRALLPPNSFAGMGAGMLLVREGETLTPLSLTAGLPVPPIPRCSPLFRALAGEGGVAPTPEGALFLLLSPPEVAMLPAGDSAPVPTPTPLLAVAPGTRGTPATPAWRRPLPRPGTYSLLAEPGRPLLVSGRPAAGDEALLLALDPTTGEPLWELRLPEHTASPPRAAWIAGRLLVTTSAGPRLFEWE
ncbi:MAG: hypothetical protein HZA54_05785, partial [Planctomycetes bacterium]|nr:hypothetical protein [Planctomycetota bacterium]